MAEVPGRCDTERPELRLIEPGHWSACHFAERLAADQAAALVETEPRGGDMTSVTSTPDADRAAARAAGARGRTTW